MKLNIKKTVWTLATAMFVMLSMFAMIPFLTTNYTPTMTVVVSSVISLIWCSHMGIVCHRNAKSAGAFLTPSAAKISVA